MFSKEFLAAAYKHSIFHKEDILISDVCGCFYCLNNFKPSEILEWVDKNNIKGETALCPKCAIDSVIGSVSGYPVTNNEFLKAMRKQYFSK